MSIKNVVTQTTVENSPTTILSQKIHDLGIKNLENQIKQGNITRVLSEKRISTSHEFSDEKTSQAVHPLLSRIQTAQEVSVIPNH